MKNKRLLLALPLVAFLLTGCFEKTISQDEFASKAVNEAERYLAQESDKITNVHIKTKLQYTYDYKEGEFYRYYMFALIVIVPLTELECVWKEDGKYYRYVDYSAQDNKHVDKEITKEEFDTYMAAGKTSILTRLTDPVTRVKELMNNAIPYYETAEYNNTYKYSSSDKVYTLTSSVTRPANYGSEETTTDKYTIKFKNSLPTKYSYKNDGEQTWEYSYGKAKFTNPKNNQ